MPATDDDPEATRRRLAAMFSATACHEMGSSESATESGSDGGDDIASGDWLTDDESAGDEEWSPARHTAAVKDVALEWTATAISAFPFENVLDNYLKVASHYGHTRKGKLLLGKVLPDTHTKPGALVMYRTAVGWRRGTVHETQSSGDMVTSLSVLKKQSGVATVVGPMSRWCVRKALRGEHAGTDSEPTVEMFAEVLRRQMVKILDEKGLPGEVKARASRLVMRPPRWNLAAWKAVKQLQARVTTEEPHTCVVGMLTVYRNYSDEEWLIEPGWKDEPNVDPDGDPPVWAYVHQTHHPAAVARFAAACQSFKDLPRTALYRRRAEIRSNVFTMAPDTFPEPQAKRHKAACSVEPAEEEDYVNEW
eukprot:TRINITY_DN4411_c0_g2_i1.p1 TRINITY_DN4411_c0_g2~~TRINITY_DN4411_c0_g2_i1.p1  ORF type:complete len:364 (+),score=94.71 TRINITY_DN4411_c0_g2_i1:57-1148(+)